MNILVIHNFYTYPTGEDLSVKEMATLLKESKKFGIVEYYKYSKSFLKNSWLKKTIDLLKASIPFYVPRDFKNLLEREKPTMAHIYNLIPLINIWILKELKKRKIPILYSAVNYRVFCPRGTCFRKNTVCTRCFRDPVIHCVLNNCLDNILFSLLYAYRASLQKKFLRHVDIFLCISRFQENFYKKRAPSKLTVHLRDYLEIPEELNNASLERKAFVLIAGRFVKEKGIDIALEAAGLLSSIPFKICGQGPEFGSYKGKIKKEKLSNVEILGWLEKNDCLRLIQTARILVFPSLWNEPGGRLIREAMILGTPVIASKKGGPIELIRDGQTGFLFDPADVNLLVNLIRKLWTDEGLRNTLSGNAKQYIGKNMQNKEQYTESLITIYNTIILKKDNSYEKSPLYFDDAKI